MYKGFEVTNTVRPSLDALAGGWLRRDKKKV